MSDIPQAMQQRMARLELRTRKLAIEKSYFQLVINLMNQLNEAPTLEQTGLAVLRGIMDNVGGTNCFLYYLIDNCILKMDAFASAPVETEWDDPYVRHVAETRQPDEFDHDFQDTLMLTPEFTRAWTWVYPLLAGNDLVGVIKLENLHLGTRELLPIMQTFFNYAALILKNKIQSQTRLQRAYNQLREANSALTQEVAERKRAEEELIRQQTFMEAILENIQDGIVACDEHGALSLFNRATRAFHGLPQRPLPPEQWASYYDLYRPDGKTPLPQEEIPLFRAFQGEVVKNAEMVIAPKEGKARTLLASGHPMLGPDGRKLGAVVSMHDITERKHTEKALKKAKDAAERANHAKSVFLANMSHELRTPLNAVIGFSQIMARDPTLSATQRENLEIINRSGEHLLNLIDDVLDMARIEAGHVQPVLEPVDLSGLARDVSDMMRNRAEAKGLALLLEWSAGTPSHVLSDPGKLRQVLINLLGNAIKYTESGGITLRLGGLPHPQEGMATLVVEVEDTGEGIAPQDMERIFQPFEQVGRRPSGEGAGLGLAITRQYLKLLGDDLSVKSTLGEGTTFRFTLPLTLAAPEQAPSNQPNRGRPIGLQPGQPHFRILVADDREETRLLLRRLLEPLGFAIREVEDGTQAVEVCHAWRPHLIWMDRRMPKMDGVQATRHIRARDGGDDPVILGLSASVFEEQKKELLLAGCDGFVRKPFREEEIYQAMEQHLQVRFLYQEEEERDVHTPPAPITRAALEGLPPAVLREMRELVEIGDIFGLNALIEGIPHQHAPLKEGLLAMAEAYRYEELLRLLDGVLGTPSRHPPPEERAP